MRLTADQGSIRIEPHALRLHVKWSVRDQGTWHDLLDSFKATFPRHEDRTYHGATKTWSVPGWHRARLGYWVDRWFVYDAQCWADEDDGHAGYGERDSRTHESSGHNERTQESGDGVTKAFAALHLLPTAPPDLITAAHRLAIKTVHPDVGGSHAHAVAVNAAMLTIRQHQRRAG